MLKGISLLRILLLVCVKNGTQSPTTLSYLGVEDFLTETSGAGILDTKPFKV